MHKHRSLLGIAVLISVLAIGVVACGGDDDGQTPVDEDPGEVLVDDSNMVIVSAGFLADSDGNTLYVFDDDEPGVSNCSEGCAQNWPPFSVDGDPVAGDGVGTLATIEREDGRKQVTHNDRPLYYYANDTGVGDQAGDGIGDVWHIVPGGE